MGQWTTVLGDACSRLPALAVGLLLLVSGPGVAAQINPLEFAVKATYLYKFAPFVEWPLGAFRSASSSLQLCVVGDDPFGALLDQAVRGQRVDGRPLVVRRLTVARGDAGCHIMYLAGSAKQSVAEALAAIDDAHVLTITDSAQDARAKGIIHFVIDDDRVRFEIDDHDASRKGITISSKVLNLAVSVRPRA